MSQALATDFELPEIDPRFDPLSTLDNTQTINRYAKDGKLFVTFHVKAVMNPLKSTEAGRAVFDQVDYIKIITPGSQLSIIDCPVTDGDYTRRFEAKYKAWKSGQVQMMSGTPIDSFPYLLNKVAMIAELKAMGIHTVEQLADLADSAKQNIMGGIELSRRAAEWINKTQGTDAQLSTLSKKNDDLQAQLDAMKAMIQLQNSAKVPSPKEK